MSTYRNRAKYIAERLIILNNFIKKNASPVHAIKASEMLAELAKNGHHVKIKTLYTDLDTLESCLGLKTAYDYQQKGYVLLEPDFEPYELRMMVNSIQSAKFITQQEADKLTDKIMDKLADEYTCPSLKRRTLVKNRARTINEKMMEGLDTIYEAIAENSQISYKNFLYFLNRGEKKKLYRINDKNSPIIKASPYNVIWDGEHFRIHLAFAEGETIMTEVELLDNMEQIEILEIPREGAGLFRDILEFEADERNNSFFPSQFKVKVAGDRLSSIINKFGNNVEIFPLYGDSFMATVNSTLTPELFLWILEFGPDAEIIFPEDAQARLTYYILELLNGNPPFRDENSQDVE